MTGRPLSGRAGGLRPEPVTQSQPKALIPDADLDAAIRIMLDAHRGQVDKGGQPYFLHPLRVMLSCTDPVERVVAVLHDTVEDSALTSADIRNLFGREVAQAVQALTRCNGEDYVSFIVRCGSNPIAREVKLADLLDNMNLGRLGREPTADDWKRHDKYRAALQVLLQARTAPEAPHSHGETQ